MDSPLVTVIITTYNYAHTVGTAIDSALAQNYPNLEVLVVDNASTDSTPELVERYAQDQRFRYVRNATNIGMVPNHNKGLREARGSYVLFLSADDLLLPHHVTRSLGHLNSHPEIDVLYADTYFINEAGAFTGMRSMGGQPLGAYSGGRNEFAQLFTEGCYMCFPTMLMRRDLFDRYGELDEEIKAADYEIVIRWAANGVRFGYLPDPNCAVRLHSSQQSSHQNYIVGGGDISEFIYMLRKFTPAYSNQLQGYEHALSRVLWARYEMAQKAGVADEDGAIRADLLQLDEMLAKIRADGKETQRLRPTVVVLPGLRISDVEFTLQSLVKQTATEWEAIAIEYGSKPYAALGEHLDPSGRIRRFQLTGEVAESAAINNALRIASGDWFLVVHAGSILPPRHLEFITTALRATGADLARTPATLGAMGNIFLPPKEGRLAYIAPFGPVESLAFTRRVLDISGSFDTRVPFLAEWDFFMRAAVSSKVLNVDSAVSIFGATNIPFQQFETLPALARQLYNRFRIEDISIVKSREEYVRALEGALAAGPPQTGEDVERFLRVVYGTGLLASA